MIDPLRHLSARRRLSLVIRSANVVLAAVLLAFALR
jgi:hypothetical protein